jgi:hypothetical protein
MKSTFHLILTITALCVSAKAQPILFDFENAPIHTSLPLDLTVGGVTAHFSATGQGFSIQTTAQSIGVLPAGFSGLGIVPNSINASDLFIAFPQTTLTDFSILYAPQELATDSSARMRVTAYLDGTFVGTNTTVADPPGTWPSATLSFSSAQPFNSVVVHYDAPPPTGGDYGTIFVADNMIVTPGVPEPSSLVLAGFGAAILSNSAGRRRRSM